jgi:predicted DsbA family dithiol-disulfide isomerase
MEVQTCAYTSPNVSNSNSDYYGKINITSVIMCFIIIYSTALSIILSIIQLIQVIKEEEEKVIEEVEVIKEEDKEKSEEELLLANYNAKERALALQAAYEERAKLTFEKWREAYSKLFKIKQELAAHGGEGSSYTENANMYITFMTKMQEEYFQTNEKLTRLEALNALKKARALDLEHYKEFIHLFNS